jgi:hypothetical protein
MKKPVPEDYQHLDGFLISPRDPETPKDLLHGTPAIVWRELDHEKYGVNGLFYDGDRKGFSVIVKDKTGAVTLEPGQYRTHALFMWDKETDELNIQILD